MAVHVEAWDDEEMAAILGRATYARAAAALVAGMEECEEYRGLLELQKVALVKNLVAHLQGLEGEFVELLRSAKSFESALGVVLQTPSERKTSWSD